MKGPYMGTITGRKFYPFSPKVKDIDIEDIAHHLSMICRFNGAVRFHYSVAQHSVYVCDLVDEPYKKWALMHDAAEAYLGDAISPLKALLKFVGFDMFKNVENGLLRKIATRFKLSRKMPRIVKAADRVMFATEVRDVAAPESDAYDYDGLDTSYAMTKKVTRMSQARAKALFMSRFERLFPDE